MYTTCSTLATDRVLVSILQSPEPHWRAQTCTLDVVQQLGFLGGSRRGRRGEQEKCLHISKFHVLARNPVVGSPHQTPDTSSDWTGLTSGISKNHGYSIRSGEISTLKFRYVTESPNKSRPRWVGKQRSYPVLGSLVRPIINNTITKTRFL